MSRFLRIWGPGLILSISAISSAFASCGSSFCSINANWDEHGLHKRGWRADLRYSFSHADTLRSGSDKISADTAAAGEVENLGTYNRILTATADYTYNTRWGATIVVPYIYRFHDHNIGPYSGSTPADYESFHTAAPGDVRIVGRYRWSVDAERGTGLGFKFGLKLDTGKQDATIKQTGEVPEEVTLQTGNGSTDAILGLFWHRSPPGQDLSWFAQGTVQTSINADSTFRPGNSVTIDGGLRYAMNHALSSLLQLNGQWNHADSRADAALTESLERSSGGKTLTLSPGLIYAVTRSSQVYALIQLPLYQYVNGEQLTADQSLVFGVDHRF